MTLLAESPSAVGILAVVAFLICRGPDMKYDTSTQTYIDVTTNDKTLGKISYNQVTVNSEIIPSSIRFGMKAPRPENLTSKTQFIGYTSFKFIRKEISSGGATP